MANFKYLDDSLNKFNDLEKLTKDGFNITKMFAEDIEEGGDGKELIENLKDVMVQLAELDEEIKCTQQAVKLTKQNYLNSLESVSEGQPQPDMTNIFHKNLNSRQRADPMGHKKVKSFMQSVYRQHLTDFSQLQEESEKPADEDAEIQMTQGDNVMKFICPITKTDLIDPVKNAQCGHSYSRFAIEQHIKNSNSQQAKCPVAGCIHHVTENNLEDDGKMAYELKKKERKLKRR